MKYVIAIIFILTLVVLPSVATVQADSTNPEVDQTMTKDVEPATDTTVTVYYFHGDRRCKTCNAIESNTKAVLDSTFKAQLSDGTVKWVVKNTDKKENEHFEKDFELLFGSVVAVKMKNGKQVEWKNLQKVWELVWDKDGFNSYIETELKAYLGN